MEQEKHSDEQEIDFVEIVHKLWRNRRFILKVTGIFVVLGLLVAIYSPKVYTASCTMVPQTGQKNASGGLGGLAAMAGISLGGASSGDIISPVVYPKIISNVDFQKELIYSKFHFAGVKEPISLYEYFTDKQYRKFNLLSAIRKYSIGLPGVIIGAIRGKKVNEDKQSDSSSVRSLTSNQRKVTNIVRNSLALTVNAKEGYISMTANMPEPLLAAELAQKGQELLQKYITEFKIEKVSSNLKFVEQSFEEAKRSFYAKQEELARFRDANHSFASSMAKTQEEKLTAEYTLLLGIYTELAKQKEQAKIAVTETTPILTVIDPVVVPSEKTKPKRLTLLFIYIFCGLIIGVGTVFFVPYLENNYISNLKDYKFIPKIF